MSKTFYERWYCATPNNPWQVTAFRKGATAAFARTGHPQTIHYHPSTVRCSTHRHELIDR